MAVVCGLTLSSPGAAVGVAVVGVAHGTAVGVAVGVRVGVGVAAVSGGKVGANVGVGAAGKLPLPAVGRVAGPMPETPPGAQAATRTIAWPRPCPARCAAGGQLAPRAK